MKIKKTKIEGVIILAFGLFFLIVAIGMNHKELINLRENKLYEITGILKDKPTIDVGIKGEKTLIIHLEEYPSINFENSGIMFRATSVSAFIETCKIGDTLVIKIQPNDYYEKLLRIHKRNFFKRIAEPINKIRMYGIRNNRSEYVNISSIIDDNSISKLFSILIGGFFVVGLIVTGIRKILK